MGRSSETRVDPNIQIQNEVIANAATLEKNVMVTEIPECCGHVVKLSYHVMLFCHVMSCHHLEKNVMVTERLMSPPSIAVQKLEPTPPGQQPSSSRPSLGSLHHKSIHTVSTVTSRKWSPAGGSPAHRQ